MAYVTDDVEAIQNRFLAEIQTGRSLRQVCKDDGMPHAATVMRWMQSSPDFANKYARARTAQADTLFDRMEAVEEAVSAGTMDSHAARVVLDSMRCTAHQCIHYANCARRGRSRVGGAGPWACGHGDGASAHNFYFFINICNFMPFQ